MQVSIALSDPNTAEAFTVTRSTGSWDSGAWKTTKAQSIQMYGIVSIASAKQIETLPEADQVHESIIINTASQIFVTSEDASGTSDIVNYQGKQFRVLQVWNYSSRGYWYAIAGRMQGS
jgi:hypothetical protein